MENNLPYLETCAAGERSGLYYTCINAYLTGSELAYILRIRIPGAHYLRKSLRWRRKRWRIAQASRPYWWSTARTSSPTKRATRLRRPRRLSRSAARRGMARHLHALSSGTTVSPRASFALYRPRPRQTIFPLYFLRDLWLYREDMIYLSRPSHSAPQAAVGLTLRIGGTVIVMAKFDPERYLALIGATASPIASSYRPCSAAS